MEGTISRFPIILQHHPEKGRRHASSTFVKAHVMERYHRQRKTASKNVATVFVHDPSMEEGGRQNSRTSQQNRLRVSAGFIECAAPTPLSSRIRNGGYSELERVPSRTTIPLTTKPMEISRLLKRDIALASPTTNSLRLRDPREQESPKFIAIFDAYFGILEDRQTPLDQLSKSWLPTAFTDLALFHAIMFYFSQHLFALCSVDHEDSSLLKHKVDAIRQISARIESTAQGCSDAIAASILCLIGHEFLKGDAPALQAHMRGLRQIISIRGGVHQLGLDGTLKTVYLSYELLVATVFRNWTMDLPILDSILCPDGRCPVIPGRWNMFTLSRNLVGPLASKFSNTAIQLLSTIQRVLSSPKIPAESDLWLDLRKCSAYPEKFTHETEAASEVFSDTTVDHILISLNLTVSLQFPNLHPASPITQVKLLKHHMSKTSMQSFWHPFPGALLWCLIMGMAASKNSLERPWFVANLMRVTTGLAFENWEGLSEGLYYFIGLGIDDGTSSTEA